MIFPLQIDTVPVGHALHHIHLHRYIVVDEEMAAGAEHHEVPLLADESWEDGVGQYVVHLHRLLGVFLAAQLAAALMLLVALVALHAHGAGRHGIVARGGIIPNVLPAGQQVPAEDPPLIDLD